MMQKIPRKIALTGVLACLALSACTEYQGRQTNCWSKTSTQDDAVARNTMSFAEKKPDCEFIEMDVLLPLEEIIE